MGEWRRPPGLAQPLCLRSKGSFLGVQSERLEHLEGQFQEPWSSKRDLGEMGALQPGWRIESWMGGPGDLSLAGVGAPGLKAVT